jgi:hypothetical protein
MQKIEFIETGSAIGLFTSQNKFLTIVLLEICHNENVQKNLYEEQYFTSSSTSRILTFETYFGREAQEFVSRLMKSTFVL